MAMSPMRWRAVFLVAQRPKIDRPECHRQQLCTARALLSPSRSSLASSWPIGCVTLSNSLRPT